VEGFGEMKVEIALQNGRYPPLNVNQTSNGYIFIVLDVEVEGTAWAWQEIGHKWEHVRENTTEHQLLKMRKRYLMRSKFISRDGSLQAQILEDRHGWEIVGEFRV
jgi:hypothetical protein